MLPLVYVTYLHCRDLEEYIYEITDEVILKSDFPLDPRIYKPYNDKLHQLFADILQQKYKDAFICKNDINKKIEVFKLYDENQDYMIGDSGEERLWSHRKITCLIMLGLLSEEEGRYNYLTEAQSIIQEDIKECELGKYYLLILLLKIYFQAQEDGFGAFTNAMKEDSQDLYDYGKHIEKNNCQKTKELFDKIQNIFQLIESKSNYEFQPNE